MKAQSIYCLLILFTFLSCQQFKEKNPNIIIDNKIGDTAKNNIKLFPDNDISYFKAKFFARFFINDSLFETINEDSSSMMSWYSIQKDTIDLVVHPEDGFGTSALLLRFINDSIKVMLLRAAHDDPRPLFKLNQKDTFSSFVEVPAKRYYLQLSEIPDPKTKQPIYGFIGMESRDYYIKTENGDSYEGSVETKYRNMFRFYFRSQYRKFSY